VTFAAPGWLWGLALLPLLALVLWLERRARRRRLLRFARPGTADRIALVEPSPRPLVRGLLLVLAAAMVFLALARPRWGETEEELHVKGLDLVIALDLSRSMLAEDLAPSRLVVARAIAREIARKLPSDRVGLVGFAGTAATLCPLTLDRGALALYLDAADPSLFSAQGTDLGAAIDEARRLFARHARARKVLVILSDGEDLEGHGVEAARRAADEGITVYAVGVGTSRGAPVPEFDDAGRLVGYEKRHGKVVTSRLDEATLAEIARAGGGAYARATGFGEGVDRVVEALSRLQRSDLGATLPRRRAERYRWPLAAAFVLAALEAMLVDRRRRREVA